MEATHRRMLTATWNVAAINNNPFEYWITYHNDDYNDLMVDIENFVNDQSADVDLCSIFSDEMFEELVKVMAAQNITNLNELTAIWKNDFRQRKAISGFLKDRMLGEKRLTSMPDRITNTINLIDGRALNRPSVINAFQGPPLVSMQVWWREWIHFMFSMEVQILSNSMIESKRQLVYTLISPIHRKKYPAISVQEQAISVQLQLLCLAILDSIFIYIVTKIAPAKWEDIRQTLCRALIHGKDDRLCQILADSYQDRHIIFLQEASSALVSKARAHPVLSKQFKVLIPEAFDPRRDQNSVILVARDCFDPAGAADVTSRVLEFIVGDFLAPGDLFATSIRDSEGCPWLLVSFHGDSGGLSTAPTVAGLHLACRGPLRGHVLLAGMDANTLSHGGDPKRWGVRAFRRLLAEQGMASVWDGMDDPFVKTTCGARTYLQTQLHKAVPFHRRFSSASISLKDWIICYADQAWRALHIVLVDVASIVPS